MKNRNFICAGLLSLIILLTGITACYYVVKKDAYDKSLINTEKNDKDDVEASNKVEDKDLLTTVTTYSDFVKYLNRDKNTFFVFGKENCSYCMSYKPVLNKVISEYNIEVVYVELNKLSQDDYHNVLNTSLTIPAKCTKENKDILLKEGFGTPLSLFTNNGSTYDCIRGYKNHDTLVGLLKQIGYIN